MTDDQAIPFIQKHLGRSRTRRGMSILCIFTAFFLVISQFGTITWKDNTGKFVTVSLFPPHWQYYIVVLAAGSLITLAWMQFGKSFLTPEIKNFHCHFCNAFMNSSELICSNCRSTSKHPKAESE